MPSSHLIYDTHAVDHCAASSKRNSLVLTLTGFLSYYFNRISPAFSRIQYISPQKPFCAKTPVGGKTTLQQCISMGLLDSLGSSSKPAASATAETSTRVSTVEAPDRRTRAQCWDARDRFFGCLDRHDIVDSIKEKDRSDRACGQEDAAFGRECVTSWVRRRPLVSSSMPL